MSAAAKIEAAAESKDSIQCIEGFERRIWIGRAHLDGDDWVIESAVQVRYWEAPKAGLPGVLLEGPKSAKQLMLDPCPVVRVNVLRVVNRYDLDEKLWAPALVRK